MFDNVHGGECCLTAVCGAEHGQDVQGYFPQTWESCLRDHLEPKSGRVSSSKMLFQGYICLEIDQMHLERPSICPLEVLCDFLGEPPDIFDEEWVLNEQGELLCKTKLSKRLWKFTISLSTKSTKEDACLSP